MLCETRCSKVEVVKLHQSSQGVLKKVLEISCKKKLKKKHKQTLKFELFQWAKHSSAPGGGVKNEKDSKP